MSLASFPGSSSFPAIVPHMTFDPAKRKAEMYMYVMRLSGGLHPLQFVNNLESDPQYSGWTKSLLQVLYAYIV